LHFEKSDANFNKKILEWFRYRKLELESKIGERLYFAEKWTKKWTRMYVKKAFEGEIFNVSKEFKDLII